VRVKTGKPVDYDPNRDIQVYSGKANYLDGGLPSRLWEKWLEDNKDSDVVKNELIFAEPTLERAKDRARERRKIRSGMEPMDPNNPPAAFARGLSNISKADLSDADMKN
jgi:hypothetical protein